MKSFRDLIVWQKSMDLTVDVYELLKVFPKVEDYALASQIRRCSVSIPSNIAEGFGRNHTKEFIRFLQISQGSVYECQTQLEIAFRVNYIDSIVFDELDSKYTEVAKMLSSLIRKIKESPQR
ncbi:four helix bundle protein [Carboxylicivirga sp. N1Y90]|uniref:four helix bundle protein n=1 Tax=Carboxylicivirga fragile TaxID=3417571 RepID=UPI003D33ADF4|nr:four helix bundle protein [Marinilabiliaceae bacterium N1Y90]